MGFARERTLARVMTGSVGMLGLASVVAAAMQARYEKLEKGEPTPLTAEQEAQVKASVEQSYETRQQRRHRERMAAKRPALRRGKHR